MPTYLRFTPQEFRALARVCRTLDLGDAAFPAFKDFLTRALADTCPHLADRVARFRKYQAGILYEGLKERRQTAARARGQDESQATLTAEECDAVRQASTAYVPHPRFLASFQNFLVRHFKQAAPGLAWKLARLNGRQLESLYEQVHRRRHEDT